MGSFNESITKAQLDQALKPLQEQVTSLTQKFDDYVKNTREFRRKLELAISEIRESNGDIADKLDELIRDWNEL